MNRFKIESGREIVLKRSDDGSHTLFVPELNEHYHSVFGARNESMHVFIEHGLNHCQKESINLLEIGFGTGLNTFLTALNRGKRSIKYYGLEKYPLPVEVVNKLQFSPNQQDEHQKLVKRIHEIPWNEMIEIVSGMNLFKWQADLLEVQLPLLFDVVYFDAFAPDIQPELWECDVFNKLYRSMNRDAIITTYCAKGIVRRRLIKAGFSVERLPGPKGKREMLRGLKSD